LSYIRSILETDWAIAGVSVSLICLAVAIVCVITFAKILRRKHLDWSPKKTTIVSLVGLILPAVLLCLPACIDWLSYQNSYDMVDRSLLGVDMIPEQRVALLGQGSFNSIFVGMVAGMGQIVLLLPCALLVGLSMALLSRSPKQGTT
jgi:hypothetical protein